MGKYQERLCKNNHSLVKFIFKMLSNVLILFKDLFYLFITVHTKLLPSCPTLCNPMDRSPPGSFVHGILQARILEWVG